MLVYQRVPTYNLELSKRLLDQIRVSLIFVQLRAPPAYQSRRYVQLQKPQKSCKVMRHGASYLFNCLGNGFVYPLYAQLCLGI